MASFNKIILIGRLTADPELRYTPSGAPVANFTIAVDRVRGKSGKDETDFINIVAWSKLAEICQQYLGKGRLVAIEGRLQIRNYETQDGRKGKAVEVIANEMQILDRPSGKTGEPPAFKEQVVDAPPVETAGVTEDVPF